MNKQAMIRLLAGKIDSLERWKAVCEEAGAYWDEFEIAGFHDSQRSFHFGSHRHVNGLNGMPSEQKWWLMREHYRIMLGVYPARTDVMTTLIANVPYLQPYCIHISKDDPAMVAYTPSHEDGLRDKQVRLSFGKLMRKLLILMTDTHIQALEASHRSELDPTFLRATTPEDVERVYRNMAGDGGCMRYSPDNFGLPGDMHPSKAYAYAGLAVAYTEVDGEIKSRSVIYDNPDNPEDKRYVRIYGDPCLKRKLELAGYRLGDLQGAKLRKLDMSTHPRLPDFHESERRPIVVPYLDGPGGNQDSYSGCYGYIIKGEDCVRLINSDQAKRLGAMGFAVPRMKSTDVRYAVPEVTAEQLSFTCAISGRQVNSLDEEPVNVLMDGEVKRISALSRPPAYRHQMQTYTPDATFDEDGDLEEGTKIMVWVTREQMHTAGACFQDTLYTGGWWLDNPVNRKANKWVQLTADMYPANTWVGRGDVVESDGVTYKRSDCHLVFDAGGLMTYVPTPKVEELKKTKDYVQVAPNGSQKALSHTSNPNLVMTLGKRRCVQDWHAVRQLFDGSWDYVQNCSMRAVLGMEVWVSSRHHDLPLTDLRLTEDAMAQAFEAYLNAAESERTVERKVRRLTDYTVTRLRAGIDSQHFFVKGGALFRGHAWDAAVGIDSMRAAVVKLKAMSDQEIIDTWDASYLPFARCWQHHAEIVFKLIDAKFAAWSPAIAPEVAAAHQESIDSLLTATAVHIRDERFAQAA